MTPRYVVRPKADQDLDAQAYYYSNEGGPELGHRFLLAAHATFTLLGWYPEMGWRSRVHVRAMPELRIFRVSGFGRMLVLYRPRDGGVDILRVVHGAKDLGKLLLREGIE